MIISEYVEMELTNRTHNKLIKKYNLNKKLKIGDIAKISISILSKSSHYEIQITCDYCNKLLTVPYKRYNLNTKVVNKYACSSKDCSNQKIKDVCQVKYGVDNPFQSEEVKNKIKETLVEKYGVEHPMFMEETKDKIKKTCFEKYGVTSYTKTDEFKEKTIKTNLDKYGVEYECKTKNGQLKRKLTRIARVLQIPDDKVNEYRKYRLKVNRMLQRNKKIILENWDGNDYYDGEYIRYNFNLPTYDRCYPHFDHRISVAYGFKNEIDYKIIGSVDNICLTKQHLNGLKKEMNDKEFKEFINKKRG
jgi:hypothetical protein